MHHFRKTIKLYRQRKHADVCPFCDSATIAKQTDSANHSYVVPNLTFYDLWEMRSVSDHLLLVPKRHVVSLSELSTEERLEMIDKIAEYEDKGYHVYARPADSVTRSVAHQHTHLIKTSNKGARATFFLQKPYFLFKI